MPADITSTTTLDRKRMDIRLTSEISMTANQVVEAILLFAAEWGQANRVDPLTLNAATPVSVVRHFVDRPRS